MLVTDGVNNNGVDPLEAAQQLGARGISIYTVGVGTNGSGLAIPGTTEEASIDEDALREIATAGHGTYTRTLDATAISGTFRDLARKTVWERRRVDVSFGLAIAGAGALVSVFSVRSPRDDFREPRSVRRIRRVVRDARKTRFSSSRMPWRSRRLIRAPRPSVRTVLMRKWDRRGFNFYTNYESRKGTDLAANPHAALFFFWDKLSRQIRIEGAIEKLTPEESDAYFRRPAARASPRCLGFRAKPRRSPDAKSSRTRCSEMEARFAGEVPRPPYWGGYRVHPERFEFWEGKPNRLHDRFVYRRDGELWLLERLAP